MGKQVALITGITGQDGSYLAEFLLEKGYEVRVRTNFGEAIPLNAFKEIMKAKTAEYFKSYDHMIQFSNSPFDQEGC